MNSSLEEKLRGARADADDGVGVVDTARDVEGNAEEEEEVMLVVVVVVVDPEGVTVTSLVRAVPPPPPEATEFVENEGVGAEKAAGGGTSEAVLLL